MHALVTGGAGFLGGHVVAELVARGARVRVLELPCADVDHLPDIECVRGDIRWQRDVLRAVAGCDAVYHLAADPDLWAPERGHFHAVNYLGARNVLAAAAELGARRIVHTSTESILSTAPSHRHPPCLSPLSADSAATLADQPGAYCRSKYRAERFALALGRRGYPVWVANPTIPIGPGDGRLSPPTRLLLDCCRGKLPAIVDCRINVVDVRDAAAALVRLPEWGERGRRNLLAGENVMLGAFLAAAAQLTGVRPPAFRIAPLAALLVAVVDEWVASVVTGRPPRATVAGVQLARRNLHVDLRETLAARGLPQRPLAHSLADAVAWLRQRGLLAQTCDSGPATGLAARRSRLLG